MHKKKQKTQWVEKAVAPQNSAKNQLNLQVINLGRGNSTDFKCKIQHILISIHINEGLLTI